MSSELLIFLVAVGIVGFFVLAFSLTILIKGRYMDSEIGTNKHMKNRGIACTSQQFRSEEAALSGAPIPATDCGGCLSCTTGYCEHPENHKP